MSIQTVQLKPNVTHGIIRRAVQIAVVFVILGGILFLAAGTLDWVWAWLYLGLYLVGVTINAALMLRHSPETIAERGQAHEMRAWDKVVSGLWSVGYFLLVPLVAGLDLRFGITGPLPLAVQLLGTLLFTFGFALFSWAMVTNAYFATVVRIQSERGHQVCTKGPYRFVRHPGYAGAILQPIGAALLLGSLWALIPGLAAAVAMIVRTMLEDRTLQQELEGYPQYAQQVRYRLVPGVW